MSDKHSLSQLRELLAKGTPGVRTIGAFFRSGDDETRPPHRWRIFLHGHENPYTNSRDCDWTHADARMIAASHNALPALLAIAEAAVRWARRNEIERQRAVGRGADPMYMRESDETSALLAALEGIEP